MIPSDEIARIVAEALKPLPPEKSPAIIATCLHKPWHPIKAYCLDCHVTRETLFFKPWVNNLEHARRVDGEVPFPVAWILVGTAFRG